MCLCLRNLKFCAEFYFIEPTEIKVNRCERFGRVREISKSRKLSYKSAKRRATRSSVFFSVTFAVVEESEFGRGILSAVSDSFYRLKLSFFLEI